MENITKKMIGDFFTGSSNIQGVTKIEAVYYSNTVHLIVKDKHKGKVVKTGNLKPFVWMRHSAIEAMGGTDENGKRRLRALMNQAGIKMKTLITTKNGESVGPRMDNGYKYLVQIYKNGRYGTFNDIIKFFKDNGAPLYPENKDDERHVLAVSPSEQFMIQSGVRLFKGIDDYNEVHRLQFDLETEGLDPLYNRIFQVGMKDNRKLNTIREIYSLTELEHTKEDFEALTDSEKAIVLKQIEREKDLYEERAIRFFFDTIDELKPDIIAGYNSANFDWPFIEKRCEILGIDIKKIAKTLHPKKEYRVNNKATLKLGQETEYYTQTIMWGHNILDVSHLVRKAQAINSDIKKWGLKYITEYSGANKPNRVYVDGSKIHKIWADRATRYAFNDENGKYHPLGPGDKVEDGFQKVKGDYIIQRYLQDDLWETEKVDEIYSQATFLLSKMLPLDYIRNATMGTATLWRIIMLTWSYENDLAIPLTTPKRDFVGGLARLVECGYAKGVVKLDYAALYPNIELTHGIFPTIDIMNVMEGLLLYVADTRDEYKALKNEASQRGDSYMESMYDKKQLPLKILANSFFGSLGAPNLFNWGDTDTAEETTARGRIYLRLMVKFFADKGFRPLVGDTDGFNFAYPSDVEKYDYVGKGTHRMVKKDKAYNGVDACVAEFNESYMLGRMGLDIDEYCRATINFKRKNYADIIIKPDGSEKIKFVGNTIKSKGLPIYIEEFLERGVKHLLEDEGDKFIELYNQWVEDIFNYRVPLMKIASKSRVKETKKHYIKHRNDLNKSGGPKAKKAHMELVLKHDLNVNLGDTIYFINVGSTKSTGNVVNKKHKDGTSELVFNCVLIPNEQLENNPDLTNDSYNVAKYVDNFNKRVASLLVVFHPDMRGNIIRKTSKDRKTKEIILSEANEFTRDETKLVAGYPLEPEHQDDLEINMMAFDDRELIFWDSVSVEPNNLIDLGITDDDWSKMIAAAHIRKKIQDEEDFIVLQEKFDYDLYKLELKSIKTIRKRAELLDVDLLTDLEKIFPYIEIRIEVDGINIYSRVLDKKLGVFADFWKYNEIAQMRDHFYSTLHKNSKKNKWKEWEEYYKSTQEPPDEETPDEKPEQSGHE